jgi:putative ABC transport system permease protein
MAPVNGDRRSTNGDRTPRLAEACLRRLLPAEDAEVIAGDLEETFTSDIAPRRGVRAARRWYWRQAISTVWAFFVRRRDPADPLPAKRTTMVAIRQDLAYSGRVFRKYPGFAITAVAMLALGIGANVAMFSLVNAVIIKPLPFADPAKLMTVPLLAPDRDAPGTFRQMVWSFPKYRFLRDHQAVFESTGLYSQMNWNLTGSSSPERLGGEFVEWSYFHVLGVQPVVGRVFSAEETRTAPSAPLAIVSHGLWQRRFGSDPTLVGRTIGLNGIPHTVLGVLPKGFRGLTGLADVWVPVMTQPAADIEEVWSHSYNVVARLKPGVSADQAQAAARVLGAQINAEYRDPFGSSVWGATALPLDDERVDPLIRRSVLLLLASVAAVLLIVCVNLANLMLVRGIARQREVAIRLALGASRLRIVRQFMTESVLLALAGAIAGLGVAYGAAMAASALMPDLRMVVQGRTAGLTRVGLGRIGLDGTTLLFTVLVALGTAVLFGLGPAWRASRRDLTATMKAGASGAVSQGSRGFGLRNLLIVGEVALALVLLSAGGLMLRSVARLQAVELGFNPVSLLSVRLALPTPQYDYPRAIVLFDQLLGRLAARPGIESVGYGNCAPVSGGCNQTIASFPDRPPVAKGRGPGVGVYWASPGYFDTLGIRLIKGRAFTDRDRAGQLRVAIVNETAARSFWNQEDPIGKRIGVGQGGFGNGAEVVGVVADVRYGAVEGSVMPDVYIPLLQSGRTSGLIFVRTRAAAQAIVPMIRQDVQALDADLPVVDVKMMDERFGDATWRTRMSAWLLGAFATLALVLAAMGIYGVMSQGVEQRTREIGVRLALGAARGDIFRLIIGRVVVVALAGIALGIGLAVPSMRLLTALLYQVRPGDPLVFAALSVVLLAVALAAAYIPARRATRVDPLTTLRAD